jgi:hypothetical protein
VAEGYVASSRERQALMTRAVDELLVEAARLGLGEADVQEAISLRWAELFEGARAGGDAHRPKVESGEVQQ